jgi:hypothetical protein
MVILTQQEDILFQNQPSKARRNKEYSKSSRKEVKDMPFGMGPTGWYAWPYMAYWMRGWSPHWPFAYPAAPWFFTKEEEKAFLEDQASALEDQLAQIKKRLEELKKQSKETK